MLYDFFRHLKILYKNFFFDENEKAFIKYCNQKRIINIRKNKTILIQVVSDYYYLAYYKSLLAEKNFAKNNKVIGIWPYFQRTVRKRNFFLEFLNETYLFFFDYIEYRKWKKLYKSVGITKIERLNISIFDRIKFFFQKKLYNSIKIDNIFKTKIADIKIGDLLYDTYLRFRAQPTLLKNDKVFIRKLVKKSNFVYLKLKELHKKYKFFKFYTSYSSYLQHGLPVRFFLKKNIKVYSGRNNSQYNKQLTKNDVRHSESYKQYNKISRKIKKSNQILNFSKNDLLLRFSDRNKHLMSYLPIDTYNSNNYRNIDFKLIDNLDGVLFLQDFYDSPHDWGNLVFDDFYKWTVYTLYIIDKYQLKIGIKPHPNSWHNSKDSIKIYERLKKKYPKLSWIDPYYPNKIIFKKIKFGISCTGTVLFELAYHGLKAVSCGDHPGIDFNFTIHCKNKIEYKNVIINLNKIEIPNFSQKNLFIYNYLYNHINMDSYKNLARELNLKEINFSLSSGLVEYIKKIEKYDYKN